MIVEDATIRQAVADGCGDDVDAGDVFELSVERAMHKGRPEGVMTYKTWHAN